VCGTSSPNNCSDPIWSSGQYQTNNITVRHSTFGRGMGIAIGSETSGSISNVQIYNNTIGLCDSGASDLKRGCGWGPALHVKTTISRGGHINNITFHNNTVWNTSMFILLEVGYQTNRNELPPNQYEPTKVHNVAFLSNTARGSATSAVFVCSKYEACHNITIVDNQISVPPSHEHNPWDCHFISDDYIVANNIPPGLEECLANSMNNFTLNESQTSSLS
jgi:Glycosyl hydrolases family 28